MKSCVFVPNPHLRLDRARAAPYVPLELLSAMAVVERAGGSPRLFDLNRLVATRTLAVDGTLWEKAAALLAELDPGLVVLETWSGTFHNTLQLAAALRERLPGAWIVFGGAGTSAPAVEVLGAFPAVDAVVRGELEPALTALARHGAPRVPGRALPAAVPGLVRREHDLIVDAALAWVEDLATLPRPAYHLAPLEPGDTIPVEPGRGCEQGCSFCALAGHWPRRYRPKSPAVLADEMIALGRRYPGSSLDLTQDPTYFSAPDRLRALCDLLRERSLRWSCHARVDRLEQDDLRRLRAAGCRGLLFGIESGCPAMQRIIGKQLCLDRLESTIATAVELGIEVRTTFILGFPEEDEPTIGRTVDAMLRVHRAGASDPVAHLLRAYPGSAVHDQHADELVFEPLLATAALHDQTSLDLIRTHPRLLPASYRVPAGLSWPALASIWVALSAYLEVLVALERHGVDVRTLLPSLRAAGGKLTSSEAVGAVGRELVHRASSLAGIDPCRVADLVTYHRAIHELGQSMPPSDAEFWAESAARLGDTWAPRLFAPWRLLRLRTPLESVLAGELRGISQSFHEWLLLTKLPNPGEVSYYTARSHSIETFVLDRTAAAALPWCQGDRDVAAIAHLVAARLGQGTAPTLLACREMLRELVSAGVVV